MDSFQNEEVEEILDETVEQETSTIEEEDATSLQKGNLKKVGKKQVPPTKKIGEEEEEDNDDHVSKI